ncbi:hypothetical protein Angca_000851, partial [Angiostrongylus cantonensis]
ALGLWCLKDGTFTMVALNAAVTALHHHVSQPIGVVGTENGSVHLLSTSHTDKLTITVEFPALLEFGGANKLDEQVVETSVECVQFAPFNSWLAVGRNNGTLCIYETNSSTPRSTYTSPSSQ